MPRYIDADLLIKELSTMYKQPTSTEDFMTVGYDKAIADTVVTTHKQPTADVVEVVRCKDCLYWKRETEPIGIECETGETAHYCSFSGITRSNEFCCWGTNESKMLKAFEEIRKRRKENEEQQRGKEAEHRGNAEAGKL